MQVKLDWQVDEQEDQELDWGAPETAAQPGIPTMPPREGLERHPELLRVQLDGRFTTRKQAGRFYLLCAAAVFVAFVAMCILI